MGPESGPISIAAAVEIARAVVEGRLSPNLGCARIAAIDNALDSDSDLSLFWLLAHEQTEHEHIGITAESLAPEILQACHRLIHDHG